MRVRTMSPFPPARPNSASRPASDFQPYEPPALPPRPEAPSLSRLLGDMKQDDYILLGIMALLFFEGCDDYILMAALGYLYIMGIM